MGQGIEANRVTAEELCCAAILAFFAVQGAVPFIAPNQALELTGAAPTGLMFYGGVGSQLVVYGAIMFLLLRQAERVTRWLGAMQWALGLAALAIASTLWSQFPSYTIRRSVPFALAGVFGLYLAMRFPVWRQLRILRVTMLVLVLGTVAMVVWFPKLGLDASAGHNFDWQGVFTQKNTCGRMMVLASAVLLAEWRFRWQQMALAGLFVAVLVMSGSRSAWLMECGVIALWGVLLLMKHVDPQARAITAFGVGAIAMISAVAGYFWLPVLAQLIGRDATLSGRTLIWKQVWIFILQKPWLGWGYDAFWHGARGEAFRVVVAVHFMVFHAHNGFLEIWLELGLAGLVLLALSYARACRLAWTALRAGEVDRIMWMVFVLALILLYDLDENTLLTYNGLFWVLYVTALANLEFMRVEEGLCGKTVRFKQRSEYAASAGVS